MSGMDTTSDTRAMAKAKPSGKPPRPKLNLNAKKSAKVLTGKKMGLGLKLDSSMDLAQSWNLSDDGTFSKDGFKINREGMETPQGKDRAMSGGVGGAASPRTFFHISPEDIYDLGPLGQGAGGIVKKCLHIPTLHIVALKNVDVFDKAKRQQLVHELKSLNGCDNPYTVSFLGAFYDSGSTKLALEYLNRGSLQDVIDKHGKLSEACLASIAKQALLGLKYLHSCKKVHRDIKPANILVDVNGNVKISDFGILAELANTQAKCTTFIGTAVYMSPERIDSQDYSYPSDIWSLGMSLVTCALGTLPFKDDGNGFFGLLSKIKDLPIPQLPDTFSPFCRSFISSCLQKNPARRQKINDLLVHPFIHKVDVNDPCKASHWPFPKRGAEQEANDLEVILKVMREKLYPRGRLDYKASLFDYARFRRLAEQLGYTQEEIQKRFETMLENEDDEEEDDYS